MIYCQTINKECLVVHPLNNTNSTQFVELIKHGDVPIFAVWMEDEECEFLWEFEMDTPSDYERVKLSVFDAICECDTMYELADALNAIFENDFADILIADECADCDGCNGCYSKSKCQEYKIGE